jgi:hypothetical protein
MSPASAGTVLCGEFFFYPENGNAPHPQILIFNPRETRSTNTSWIAVCKEPILEL